MATITKPIVAVIMGLTVLLAAGVAVLWDSLTDPPQASLIEAGSLTSEQRVQMLTQAWAALTPAGQKQTCRQYREQTTLTVLRLSEQTNVGLAQSVQFLDARCRALEAQ